MWDRSEARLTISWKYSLRRKPVSGALPAKTFGVGDTARQASKFTQHSNIADQSMLFVRGEDVIGVIDSRGNELAAMLAHHPDFNIPHAADVHVIFWQEVDAHLRVHKGNRHGMS